MSITRAELEGAVEVLNNRLDLPTDGKRGSLGSIYIAGAYGGWCLMQIVEKGDDHITYGFVSKPALYAKTWDIIKGIDLARKATCGCSSCAAERNPSPQQ